MNKKFIRNIILLLLVPVIITLIVYKNNVNNNSFVESVSYNEQVVNNYQYQNELHNGNLFASLNDHYTYIVFTAIGFTILFFMLYAYLTKKKGW